MIFLSALFGDGHFAARALPAQLPPGLSSSLRRSSTRWNGSGRGLSHPLEFTEDQILYPAADSLNYVQNGMRQAVDEQVRSEKMKVELITNVSHDLKTPLTPRSSIMRTSSPKKT